MSNYYVFKPVKLVNGKKKKYKFYSGRYKLDKLVNGKFILDDNAKFKQVPLKTTDKQIALVKIKRIYEEEQKIKYGLIDNNSNDIKTLLPVFIDYKLSDNRTKKYCIEITGFIERLCSECKWQYLTCIAANDFVHWKLKHLEYSIKTKNEYLGAIKNFIKWAIDNKHLKDNPLSSLKKISSKGSEKRIRRALTVQEIIRLLNVSTERMPLYYTALYTGLRRSEIFKLEWKDVFIDNDDRYIKLLASITKNGKSDVIPIHNDLKKVLLDYRPINYLSNDNVFKKLYRLEEFKEDLKKANISYIDEQGCYFDFHALRHTYNTLLALNGVSLRHAMELMRHSEEHLTSKVYLANGMISTYSDIDKLPSILDFQKGSLIGSQEICFNLQKDALADIKSNSLKYEESKKSECNLLDIASNDIENHQKAKWLRQLDSNQRPSG